MAGKKKTITDELNLLLKRQSVGEEKTLERELSLIEKLEAEVQERKKEMEQKLKEEEDKNLLQAVRSLMKKHDLQSPEELEGLTVPMTPGTELTEAQREALAPLLQEGKEISEQFNKFLDINATKQKLTHLYQAFL